MKGWDFDTVALDAQIACVWEATARKVGNVHPGAAFADVEYTDFVTSAAVLGQAFAVRHKVAPEAGMVGRMVLLGGGFPRHWVGSNTNLGIALLLAPLAAAKPDDLRTSVRAVLTSLTVADSRYAYEAFRVANPGGLGRVPEQDVRDEPTVTLFDAMGMAADRDLIARQYATGYADVFDFGVPAFRTAFGKFGRVEPAVIECQLKWLAEFPDSLIARKNGPAVAEEVRGRVRGVLARGGLDTPEGRRAGVELDRHLRSDGNKLNPGTTADLVAACLFVALLENRVTPAGVTSSAPFRWDAPDWL